MVSRLNRLRARLEAAGLPAMLVTEKVNRSYLSGFAGSLGWAVITPDQQILVVDDRYTEQARAQAVGWDVRRVEFQAFFDGTAIVEAVRGLGLTRLGFEADKVTVAQHAAMARSVSGIELVPGQGQVETIRRIKEPEEIALVERACGIAERAIDQALPLLRPGTTEAALAWALERTCREAGAQGMAFCLVGSGPRSSLPHSAPTDRALADGDLVLLDIGPMLGGYYADITRMFVVGVPQPWQREIHALARAAQQKALDACRPGMTAGELDTVAREHITQAGYGDRFLHLLGHGVGLQGSGEGPIIDRGIPDMLEAGMIITIEPGIYLEGRGGVRVEETVVITHDGCRSLTRYPHDLTAAGSRTP
ncbi:MAG: Xaa-Pro peptidase family protein [bacterium]|nr:Xaa-Pro peptidase family protein [bacterium]